MKALGVNNTHVANITGNTHDSIRSVVRPNTKDFPRWAKLAVWVFENLINKVIELKVTIKRLEK
tara:strand:+ start:204 stop:395 length:192 start_codon:yes stop_codon:yes gene_type:complete